MKLKLISFTFLITTIILLGFTSLFSNLWSLLIDKEYFIPQESNIFEFESTKMNFGSGEWWLYGEDDEYYYGLNQVNATPKYYKLKKGKENLSFNKYDYDTWKKKFIMCLCYEIILEI